MNPDRLFTALLEFTKEVHQELRIPFDAGRGRNHYGRYRRGKPTGHVLHYTASPDSSTGRVKTLMRRFAINSGRKVGVHFIVFDTLHPELEPVRARYKNLFGSRGPLKVDVLHYGLDLAFWASNWANRFTVATEMRNVGRVHPDQHCGRYYWGRKKNAGNEKYRYEGREPVEVRGAWWEPFSDDQMKAVYRICSSLKTYYGEQFVPEHFLGHLDIHRNKWDPAPHFPFGRLKRAVFEGKRFSTRGYLREVQRVSCPAIMDDETASSFLLAMGYLPGDWKTAVKLFQHKMSLARDGKVGPRTMRAMNRCRRAYRLTTTDHE